MEQIAEVPRRLDRQALEPLVSIENLRVEYETDGGIVVAVDDVTFTIIPGETAAFGMYVAVLTTEPTVGGGGPAVPTVRRTVAISTESTALGDVTWISP